MSAKKRWLLLLMGAFVVTAGAARAAGSFSAEKLVASTASHPRVAQRLSQKPVNPRAISRYRAETWRWQALTGSARTGGAVRPSSAAVLRYWVRAAGRAYVRAIHPPHKGAWLCIHRYEGAWSDSGDPYWGGLQMDRGFMAGYAPRYLLRRGLANNWTPLEQMWVAERAYSRGRGFYSWPNTARSCGLM